jgi:hypothetical protein
MSKSLAYRGRVARNIRSGKYVPPINENAHTGVVLSNGAKQVTVVGVRGGARVPSSKALHKTGLHGIGEIRVMFSEEPTHQVKQAIEIWRKQGRLNPTATRAEILKLFGRNNSHPLDVVLKQNLSTNLPQPFVKFIKLYFKRNAKR